MKSKMRCPVCHCKRKKSHEKKCGSDKANDPKCVSFDEFDRKAHKAKIKKEITAIKDAEKAKIKKLEEEKAKQESAKEETVMPVESSPVTEEVKV